MPATFENVSPDRAVDGQCWIETLSPDLCLANSAKKEVAHLVRHQRSKNDPGWGVAAIAPSHLHIVSSIAAIYARCPLPVCSKLHNFEISRGHFRRSTLRGTRREKPGSPSLELAS